jgi:hypothetical protein
LVRSKLECLLLFARQDIERERYEFAKLETDMALATFEVRFPFASMFLRQELDIVGAAYMQDR